MVDADTGVPPRQMTPFFPLLIPLSAQQPNVAITQFIVPKSKNRSAGKRESTDDSNSPANKKPSSSLASAESASYYTRTSDSTTTKRPVDPASSFSLSDTSTYTQAYR